MDEEAYTSVVMEHKDRVYGFASHLLGDREEGKDIAQEVLIRLWEHRDEVPPEHARSWLLRSAHHLCLDRLRARARRPQAPAAALDCIPDVERDRPDRRIEAGRVADSIWRALSDLTPRDRSLVLLRDVHGMPYEDMAEMLSLPLGTLKAALHRARDRCRRALAGAGVQP